MFDCIPLATDYDAERRRALERWADRLGEIVGEETKAQKVVRLR